MKWASIVVISVGLFVFVGCGASLQEQYATALSIRDQEKKDLENLSASFRQACEDYAHIDQAAENRTSLLGKDLAPSERRALGDSAEVFDLIAQQQATDKLISLNEFTSAAMDPDTREAGRLDRWAEANQRDEVRIFRQQLDRVIAAEAEVAEIRKAMAASNSD